MHIKACLLFGLRNCVLDLTFCPSAPDTTLSAAPHHRFIVSAAPTLT